MTIDITVKIGGEAGQGIQTIGTLLSQVYGLTKGQASPTSLLGTVTRLQSQRTTSQSFNPMAVALAAGIGFLARGFCQSHEPSHGMGG